MTLHSFTSRARVLCSEFSSSEHRWVGFGLASQSRGTPRAAHGRQHHSGDRDEAEGERPRRPRRDGRVGKFGESAARRLDERRGRAVGHERVVDAEEVGLEEAEVC